MARTNCHVRLRDAAGLLLLAATLGAAAPAPAFTLSASVDKTTVKVGDALTLTVTLTGELHGVAVPPLTFPEEFTVAARSQGTSLSMQGGQMERSMTLSVVLVPQHAGSFSLGPFTVEHEGTSVSTEPITVTVEPSSLAPSVTPPGGRITL